MHSYAAGYRIVRYEPPGRRDSMHDREASSAINSQGVYDPKGARDPGASLTAYLAEYMRPEPNRSR